MKEKFALNGMSQGKFEHFVYLPSQFNHLAHEPAKKRLFNHTQIGTYPYPLAVKYSSKFSLLSTETKLHAYQLK
jgi:hypothetical protein